MSNKKNVIKKFLHFIFVLTKILFLSIPYIFQGIKVIIKIVSALILTLRQRIKRLFRFSITFKITVVYALIFSILSIVLSTGILVGFRFYLMEKVSYDLQKQMLSLQVLAGILFFVNTVGILFTLLIGSKVTKKMLDPIKKMTDTTKVLSINDLNKRLDVSGAQDELRELAETFNQMIDRIQDSYDRQNRFVSDASHELRTPIAVIQGYASMLDRWGKYEEKVLEESIEAIKDESENMKDLIEGLLFLARSDNKRQLIEKQEFCMNELVDEVMKETQLIDSKHRVTNEHNANILFYGDRKLLKQMMRVFIENSVKFTPVDGQIQVNTFESKKYLNITIEDTGVGIPKDDIPHIFDRFYRSDKSRNKETGGHGLGLSIAKWIIDKHSGKIEVESTIHVGTKFKILLPMKK